MIGSFALLIFVIYLWPSRLLSDKNIFENGLNDWTFTVPKSLGTFCFLFYILDSLI